MASVWFFSNIPLNNKYSDPIIFKYKSVNEFLTAKAGDTISFLDVNVGLGSIIETTLTIKYGSTILQNNEVLAKMNYAKITYSSTEAPAHGDSYDYYYFVKGIVYESRDKIRCTLELDVFTTYGMDISFSSPLMTERKHCDRWKLLDQLTHTYSCMTEDALLSDTLDNSFRASFVKQEPTILKRKNDLFSTDVSDKLAGMKWIYVFHTPCTDEVSGWDAPKNEQMIYCNGSEYGNGSEKQIKLQSPLRCVVFPSEDIKVYGKLYAPVSTENTFTWSYSAYEYFVQKYGSYIVSIVVSDYPPFSYMKTSSGSYGDWLKLIDGELVIGDSSNRELFYVYTSENGSDTLATTSGVGASSTTNVSELGITLSSVKSKLDSGHRVPDLYLLYASINNFNPKFQADCSPSFTDYYWYFNISSPLPTKKSINITDTRNINYEPKLYTQPYYKMELRCFQCDGLELNPILDSSTDFIVQNINIAEASTITAEGVVVSLNKQTGIDKHSEYYGGKTFPKNIYLPASVDQYQSFLSYNGNQFQSEYVLSNIHNAIQAFSTTPAKHFANMGGGAQSGSKMSIAQEAVSLGADQLEDAFSWASSIVNYESKVKDLKDAPDKYTGVSQTPYMTELQGTSCDWILLKYEMIDSEKEIVFDYFYNYGYQVDRMCNWDLESTSKSANADNIFSRKLFNYVKLGDDGAVNKMNGDIPLVCKTQIARVLNRGTKLWLLQDTTDYSYYLTETQENAERYF